jgi:sulfate adenylyltransferase subunit 1
MQGHGVIEQTRRHSIIASLLNIPHVIVAINKMDMVGYSQDTYNNIVIDFAEVAVSLGLKNVTYIPISALMAIILLTGQTIFPGTKVNHCWNLLENVEVQQDIDLTHARFPVQYVIRPQTDGCMITGDMPVN